ncbi:hypothetical protein P0L94_11580 [Microbacter sp. GSS18]|nr:hypothetical protein P0L94_11580 [Microbacter sp. GSS18]
MTWLSPGRRWRSGPWSLELRDDELADVAFDGGTVLRSIRAVVRDRNWDTAPLVVDDIRETDTTLTLHVHSEALGSSFAGVVRVEARADTLVVVADLESAGDFQTNRTGLVVLHPPQLAGVALDVTHSDDTTEHTAFPVAISPHQPVLDIAGLVWHDGRAVSVGFEGDVFEMEDQRNWTDASYKTYSRPLALPFPYPIAAGERVRQSITVRVAGAVEGAPTDAGATRITLAPAGAVPALGLGASTAPDPAPVGLPRIGETLLVELDLGTRNWRAALGRAASRGLPLDVRFVLDHNTSRELDAQLADGVAALADADVRRVAVFQIVGPARHVSDEPAVEALRTALADAGLDVPVIGGARSHFTELNRERQRLPADLDGLAVTTTPLFHALGTEQLIESVAMQRLVAQQSFMYADGLPVHIGPVCLRPRFNDVATTPQPGPARDDLAGGYGAEVMGANDERQSARELAAWLIASAAALAVPGVASLTYFEEWGPRGIRSSTGEPYPVAAAVEALAALAGGELLSGDSPDGLVWAIGAVGPDGTTTVLAANLDSVARDVHIATPAGQIDVHLAPFGHAVAHAAD